MRRRLFAGFTLFALLLAFATVSHAAPFIDNGDGTVTDQATGLVWQKSEDSILRNWQGAMDYCRSNAAGLPGSGWRLPTVEELISIAGAEVFRPALYFNWSASSNASDPVYAWAVGFDRGEVGYVDLNDKAYYYYVRCVR